MRVRVTLPFLALSAVLIAGCASKPAGEKTAGETSSSAAVSQPGGSQSNVQPGAQAGAGMVAHPEPQPGAGSHAGHDHAAHEGSHAGHDHAAPGAHADASSPGGNPADVPRVSIDSLKSLMQRGEAIVIDVRGKEAFNAGHIDGAIWMDDQALRNPGSKLPKDKKIVTYCA